MDHAALLRKYGRHYKAGTVLFREGEMGSTMYVVQKGSVRITRQVGSKEALLAVLPPGEFFGEMALVNDRSRSATATVAEDAYLVELDKRTFEAMIRGNTEIAVRMIKRLADRLERANRQIDVLLHREADHRVVFHLHNEAAVSGTPGPAGILVRVTEQNLSQQLGLTPGEVRDVLGRLERARLVRRTSGGDLLISEVGRLIEFLEVVEIQERFGTLERTPYNR